MGLDGGPGPYQFDPVGVCATTYAVPEALTLIEGVQAFTVVDETLENDVATKVAGGLELRIMK